MSGGPKALFKRVGVGLLVGLVVVLAVVGIPVPVVLRGQHRRSLRNDYVASEVVPG